MSAAQVWSNVLAYSLQIGLLVGLGALAPAILRVKMPRARLLYWQVLLVACLALPWVRSSRRLWHRRRRFATRYRSRKSRFGWSPRASRSG
jgi:hypothetical protein